MGSFGMKPPPPPAEALPSAMMFGAERSVRNLLKEPEHPARPDLFRQIRAGLALKPSGQRQLKPPKPQGEDLLEAALARVRARVAPVEDEDDGEFE